MATVERLIEIYDRAPSDDSISARRLEIFQLNYARAEDVATTIKEVYRDLLSTKDKEFAGKKDEKQSNQMTSYYRIYGGSSNANNKPTKVKASFAGALSVGVNKAANTVIVSVQEGWMPSIEEMIEYLDENARTTTTVHQVSGRISSTTLKAALAALGQPTDEAKTQTPANANQQQPTGGNQDAAGGKQVTVSQ